jgi:phosphoribosylanthranilate isomerase
MRKIAQDVGYDRIQLSGDEAPEVLAQLDLPVIKALRLRSIEDLAKIDRYRSAHAVLIDAATPGHYGGTGQVADWSLARAALDHGVPVVLAGGLTAENVADAIRAVGPHAIDVCSGVEAAPGRKDPPKLHAMFAALRTLAPGDVPLHSWSY